MSWRCATSVLWERDAASKCTACLPVCLRAYLRGCLAAWLPACLAPCLWQVMDMGIRESQEAQRRAVQKLRRN